MKIQGLFLLSQEVIDIQAISGDSGYNFDECQACSGDSSPRMFSAAPSATPNFTNEAKRLLKTKEIILLQIAKAKRYMKTNNLAFVKPRGY